MEYFAFGETFVEEHRSSNNSPYKFNGKELDEETGWYYYGARYYDPRVSVWLSADPLANVDYLMNDEAYINGEHNSGVYNSFNHNSYGYCYQNPIKYVDPNGKQAYWQTLDSYKDASWFERKIIDIVFTIDFLTRETSKYTISNQLLNHGEPSKEFLGNVEFFYLDATFIWSPVKNTITPRGTSSAAISSSTSKLGKRLELAQKYGLATKFVDFSKKVYTQGFNKGTKFVQYRLKGYEGSKGAYYAPVGTTPEQIGLRTSDVAETYIVTLLKDVKDVITSTHAKNLAPYYDETGKAVKGGGTQYKNFEISKEGVSKWEKVANPK